MVVRRGGSPTTIPEDVEKDRGHIRGCLVRLLVSWTALLDLLLLEEQETAGGAMNGSGRRKEDKEG